jgi:hypothetical protein
MNGNKKAALASIRQELAHMATVAVYFAQDEFRREIKIGFSTQVQYRLNLLGYAGFTRVTLLGWVPGGPKVEREMHAKFAQFALGGEWFEPAPELLAFIEESTRHDETPQVASIYGRITDWGYDRLVSSERVYSEMTT